MVRLKEVNQEAHLIHREDFNSTMVRLKGHSIRMYIDGESIFQFHYGTIKRFSPERRNSGADTISIPLWYD